MKNSIQEIETLLSEGRLHEAKSICHRVIAKKPRKECQYEIYKLAVIYYAVQDYHAAKLWIDQTNADPINSIPFRELVYKKCNLEVH